MPILSAAEQADLESLHDASIADEATVAIWRNPTLSGGKVGAPTLIVSGVAMRIRPAGQASTLLQQRTIPQEPLAAARVSHIGKCDQTIDIRIGDTVVDGATSYKVEGLGAWLLATTVALNETKARPS